MSCCRSGAFRKLILAGGLGLITLTQAQAVNVNLGGPTPVPTNGDWVQFRWFDADPASGATTPSIDNPFEFTIPAGTTGILDVTDYALTGDEFSISDPVFGLIGSTSSSTINMGLDERDVDDAFANTDFSSGTFTLGPGTYSLDIDVTALSPLGNNILNGGGFLRVNLQGTPVPEPGSAVWLLGVGLLVGARRRR